MKIYLFLILLSSFILLSCDEKSESERIKNRAEKKENITIPGAYDSLLQNSRFSSPEKLVMELYNSISFKKDSRPQLNEFRKLFHDDGILRSCRNNKTLTLSVSDFINNFYKQSKSGKLLSFQESEVKTDFEVYEFIASASSSYTTTGETEKGEFCRKGINLIQFTKYRNRWYISSIIWSDEDIKKD